MQINLNDFDLPELMGALGAAQSALGSMDDDPNMPAIFKGQATRWAQQIEKLSQRIAETHNGN